jgi:virulence-associated protein VapD
MILFFIILVITFIPRHRPCEEPLTYHIGKIDERFGLSVKDVSDIAVTAASLWGKVVSRELFQESPTGAIEINFVYDYRQEATDKLKMLSYNIDNTKSSYDDLKTLLENHEKEYDQKSTALSDEFKSYNARVADFNREAATMQGVKMVSEEAICVIRLNPGQADAIVRLMSG